MRISTCPSNSLEVAKMIDVACQSLTVALCWQDIKLLRKVGDEEATFFQKGNT